MSVSRGMKESTAIKVSTDDYKERGEWGGGGWGGGSRGTLYSGTHQYSLYM